MELTTLTKALTDNTRMRILILIASSDKELCVCELTHALNLSQPKISRHLAVLREAGILKHRKAGLWVYYRLHTSLPEWGHDVIRALKQASEGKSPYCEDIQYLQQTLNDGDMCN